MKKETSEIETSIVELAVVLLTIIGRGLKILILMSLWNKTVVSLFGLPKIKYSQAYHLIILSNFFFQKNSYSEKKKLKEEFKTAFLDLIQTIKKGQ